MSILFPISSLRENENNQNKFQKLKNQNITPKKVNEFFKNAKNPTLKNSVCWGDTSEESGDIGCMARCGSCWQK